jgi:hypothetical protein
MKNVANLAPPVSMFECQVLEAAHGQIPLEDGVIICGKKGYKRSVFIDIGVGPVE